MKLSVTCRGHAVVLNLNAVGPVLTGSVSSAEFGVGTVRARETEAGLYEGKVSLDGYEADFTLRVVDTRCAGEVKYGWFFKEPFTGTVS
jgi:hypothetical protein